MQPNSTIQSSIQIPMAFNYSSKCYPPKTEEEEEEEKAIFAGYAERISQLPVHEKEPTANPWDSLRLYNGQWRARVLLPAIMAIHDHFKARPTDTLLASYPKCGTTWVKSLVYTITTRREHPLFHLHPLLTYNPHRCIEWLERLYLSEKLPELEVYPSPRFFQTHVFYSDLPASAREHCKIVYICREPKDNYTSLRHSLQGTFQNGGTPLMKLELEPYCQGVVSYGSVWDHVIGYWKAHQEDPERVMFLKFEDLKRDAKAAVRSLGSFLGCPFTEEEEGEGVVEGIVNLCSLENLKGLEVNQKGVTRKTGEGFVIKNSTFFRKGEVGDWVNLLTPEMGHTIDKVTGEKLAGTGISFD